VQFVKNLGFDIFVTNKLLQMPKLDDHFSHKI